MTLEHQSPIRERFSSRSRVRALGWVALSASSVLSGAQAAAADPIRVTATTGQVGDLTRNIGGDYVKVTTLMGAGVDPHLFKASERNVEDLIDSDAIFYSGLHLEGKLGEVLHEVSKRRTVIAVGDAIPVEMLETPEAFEGNPDPHVWFDPTLWQYCIQPVVSALSEKAPEHAAEFEANGAAYYDQLSDLHAYAAERFNTIPSQQRVLVTAHDAFGYLGRQYDIEVVGLQGISTATEAGVRDVQRIADLLAQRQIPTIFVETSVPRRTIEAVQVAAEDRGWSVSIGSPLYSDALGDEGTEEGTYIGMFKYDVETIVKGLGSET